MSKQQSIGEVIYCKRCAMSNGIPGVILDEDGVCNVCNQSIRKETTINYIHALRECMSFEKHSNKDSNGKYDCILMLSGGKDSIYMLYKLVTEFKRRPLAFTFNTPFVSPKAVNNIEKVLTSLNIDHMYFSSHQKYNKIMKAVFSLDKEKIPEKYSIKLPCVICSDFFIVSAFFLALQMKIPYVLYCADPTQTFAIEHQIKNVINEINEFLGEELAKEIFEDKLETILNMNDNELPKIIFPYATWWSRYNAEKIISELTSLNLYDGHPIQTHCSLFVLLNYYSFKNYYCPFYSHESSNSIRKGEVNREDVIEVFEGYRRFFSIIDSKEEVTEEGIKQLKQLLGKQFPNSEEEQQYLYTNILSLKEISQKLGLKL